MAAENHTVKFELFKQFKLDEKDLKNLCLKMGVRSLAVFGSVISGDFKIGQSDIDFLVEFETVSADRYFDFLDGLKELFKYDKVDLVTVPSLKNQVIRQAILSSQENIYAA